MAERTASPAPAERSVPVGALASPYSVTGPGGPCRCTASGWIGRGEYVADVVTLAVGRIEQAAVLAECLQLGL